MSANGYAPPYGFHGKGLQQYICPVEKCSSSHGNPVALQQHLLRAHAVPPPPNLQPQLDPRQQQNSNQIYPSSLLPSASTSHALGNGNLLVMPSTAVPQPSREAHRNEVPRMNMQYPVPASTLPQWISRAPTTINATEHSMPPPQIQNLADHVQSVNEQAQRTWLLSSDHWPIAARNLVRNLVIKHRYLSSSDFVENQQKFTQMFEEFLSQTDFGGWAHSRTDKKLLALFKGRSDLAIKELVASGQLQWKTNAVSSPTVPMTATQVTALGTEPSLATPPTTPILANKHTCNPRGIWDASDAATQIRLFRYIIRSAKDPQSLISEWQQHIGSVRPSGGERTVEERLAALERGSSLPQEVNTTATAIVPQVSKANASGPKSSLAIMIQERKMENKLKRKREQSEAEANKREEQKRSKGDDV